LVSTHQLVYHQIESSTTCRSSLNVSGVTILNNFTIINGNTQLQSKISISGQEYLVAAQTDETHGIALLLGINLLNARALFIWDSAKLRQNATNSVIALNPSGGIYQYKYN
jgi:hypothetical protein